MDFCRIRLYIIKRICIFSSDKKTNYLTGYNSWVLQARLLLRGGRRDFSTGAGVYPKALLQHSYFCSVRLWTGSVIGLSPMGKTPTFTEVVYYKYLILKSAGFRPGFKWLFSIFAHKNKSSFFRTLRGFGFLFAAGGG